MSKALDAVVELLDLEQIEVNIFRGRSPEGEQRQRVFGGQVAGQKGASLDHAMWFHRPFRADRWLLYSQESPAAGGARGLARGELFTREGDLVVSVVQEGLIRTRV